MKTLKEFLTEEILNIKDNIENLSVESLIEDFIEDNYYVKRRNIQIKKERDKYIVSSNRLVEVKNKNITELTNGLFEWGEVGRSFYCQSCTSLKSLEGAPKKVGEYFSCSGCTSLKDLKGAPEKVGEDFACNHCTSLKSLKGAPKEVGDSFYCSDCGKKFTEEDVRNVCDVNGKIYI